MTEVNPKSRKRKRTNKAKVLRCKTLLAVLENPGNPVNLGAVIRNIDILGIGKLYVVGKKFEGNKNNRIIRNTSCGSTYVYVYYFDSTIECMEYLNKRKYISLVTSPHQKEKSNYPLMTTDFTKYKKLAVWFGNEGKGITYEALEYSSGCINIDMSGIGESLNLSNASAIILQHIAYQRRQFKLKIIFKIIIFKIIITKLLL